MDQATTTDPVAMLHELAQQMTAFTQADAEFIAAAEPVIADAESGRLLASLPPEGSA